jgi:tRNA1Val (adenine37-N6)-methyltransferase
MEDNKALLIRKDETLDDLIIGGLKLIQSRDGYRFSLDAVLVSFFPNLKKVNTVVDLGTGNGVIPLLLSARAPHLKITGIEIQDNMVDRARRGIKHNRMEKRIEIIQEDIRQIEKTLNRGIAELVISNPPFWKQGEGRLNINQEAAAARHEIYAGIEDIIRAAAYILKPGGNLCIIHRADRLIEIIRLFTHNKLGIKRIRMVHSFIDREAKMVLIEAQKARTGETIILPPLIIYENTGEYRNELKKIYGYI